MKGSVFVSKIDGLLSTVWGCCWEAATQLEMRSPSLLSHEAGPCQWDVVEIIMSLLCQKM